MSVERNLNPAAPTGPSTGVQRITLPVLSLLVVALAIALAISLVDRPHGQLATKSAPDSIRIACSELAQVNPSTPRADKAAFASAADRLNVAWTAGELAASLDSSDTALDRTLSKPAEQFQLDFRLHSASLAAARAACEKY